MGGIRTGVGYADSVSSEDEGGRMLSCMDSIIVDGYCVVQTKTQHHRTMKRETHNGVEVMVLFLFSIMQRVLYTVEDGPVWRLKQYGSTSWWVMDMSLLFGGGWERCRGGWKCQCRMPMCQPSRRRLASIHSLHPPHPPI